VEPVAVLDGRDHRERHSRLPVRPLAGISLADKFGRRRAVFSAGLFLASTAGA
jgi:hypothetical protein